MILEQLVNETIGILAQNVTKPNNWINLFQKKIMYTAILFYHNKFH